MCFRVQTLAFILRLTRSFHDYPNSELESEFRRSQISQNQSGNLSAEMFDVSSLDLLCFFAASPLEKRVMRTRDSHCAFPPPPAPLFPAKQISELHRYQFSGVKQPKKLGKPHQLNLPPNPYLHGSTLLSPLPTDPTAVDLVRFPGLFDSEQRPQICQKRRFSQDFCKFISRLNLLSRFLSLVGIFWK